MNPIERIYKIQHLLQEKKIVPLQTFLDSMEVSLATFKRDLERLRDRFGAPVIYDRALNGYCYDHNHQSQDMSTSELPGLWFSEAEATALITMQQLLSSLDYGNNLMSKAICAHMRFSASSIITDCGPNATSFVASSP